MGGFSRRILKQQPHHAELKDELKQMKLSSMIALSGRHSLILFLALTNELTTSLLSIHTHTHTPANVIIKFIVPRLLPGFLSRLSLASSFLSDSPLTLVLKFPRDLLKALWGSPFHSTHAKNRLTQR